MTLVRRNSKNVIAAIVVALCSLVLVLALVPAQAFAVKQSDIDAAAQKVNELNEQLDLLVDKYNSAMSTYNDATAKYEAAQAQIDVKTQEQKKFQGSLSKRATSMYRNGSADMLTFVLGSSSFDELSNRLSMCNKLNESDANLIQDAKTAKEDLEAVQAEYAEQKAAASTALAEASAQKSSVESEQASFTNQLNSLKSQYGDELEQARQSQYTPTSGGGGGGGGGGHEEGPGDGTVVGRAQACLGCPYVYGAAGPGQYDCSGLVSYALTGRHDHVYVSQDFWAMSAVSDPRPGDVCACSEGHCGVYIGGGQMIHAPHTGDVVRVAAARGKIVRP